MGYNDTGTVMDVVRTDAAEFFRIVTHPHMGGLPLFFYPAFHVDQPSAKDIDVEYGIEVSGEWTLKARKPC